MNNNYLGKDINIPKEYDPSILSPLSRLESRLKSGLEEFSDSYHGRDYWTSYENSWLDEKGIPQVIEMTFINPNKFEITDERSKRNYPIEGLDFKNRKRGPDIELKFLLKNANL